MKGVCTRHSPFVISCDPIWKGTGHDSLAKYVPHFIPTPRFFAFGANRAIFGTGKPKSFFISFSMTQTQFLLVFETNYFCSYGQGVHFDNSHPLYGGASSKIICGCLLTSGEENNPGTESKASDGHHFHLPANSHSKSQGSVKLDCRIQPYRTPGKLNTAKSFSTSILCTRCGA